MTLDIHAGVIILWVISALLVWGAFKAFDDWETFAGFMLLGCAAGMGYWGYHEADPQTAINRAEEDRRRAEVRRQQETPHVVREADGCKVYAFKSGERWHYFTRCPNAHTVTDTAYEHCTGSGKSRSCKELHSSIETR